jgi:hypothetical protein
MFAPVGAFYSPESGSPEMSEILRIFRAALASAGTPGGKLLSADSDGLDPLVGDLQGPEDPFDFFLSYPV